MAWRGEEIVDQLVHRRNHGQNKAEAGELKKKTALKTMKVGLLEYLFRNQFV